VAARALDEPSHRSVVLERYGFQITIRVFACCWTALAGVRAADRHEMLLAVA
jgi:hypothetical protein